MASYTWIGSGDYYLSNNWKDQNGNTPAGPPTPSDSAFIGSGSATADGGIVTNAGLSLSGASLTVTTGGVTAGGSISVGKGSALTITKGDLSTTGNLSANGGTVILNKGNALVSSNTGTLNMLGAATVTIAGSLTLNTGNLASSIDNASTLNALGGLTVGGSPVASFFNSDLYVFAGSTVNTGSADVMVGDAGRGQVVLFTGSSFNASGSNVVLGSQKGSTGRIDVHDANTNFLGGTLTVGKSGSAQFLVTGTAHILGATTIGTGGSMSVGGTATIDGDLTIVAASNSGSVNVNGTGKLTWNLRFDVGEGGHLTIASGGSAVGGDLTIGMLGSDDKFGAFASVDGPSKLSSRNLTIGGATTPLNNSQGKPNGTEGMWSYTGPVGYLTISHGAVATVESKLTLANIIEVSSKGAETSFGRLMITTGGSLEVGGTSAADADGLRIEAGGTIVGHGLIDSDDTGTVTKQGAPIYALKVENLGTIDVENGVMTVHGSLTGSGQVLIERNATFHLSGAGSAESRIAFDESKGDLGYETTLKLDDPEKVKSKITGFQQGDVIDLTYITTKFGTKHSPITATYSKGTLTLANGIDLSVKGLATKGDPVPTIGMKPDKSDNGTDLETVTLKSLKILAGALYNDKHLPDPPAPPSEVDALNGHKYELVKSTYLDSSPNFGFQAAAYRDGTAEDFNPSDQNIVIVFRGTDNDDGALISFKNWLANGSFIGGVNPMFRLYMQKAAQFVSDVVAGAPEGALIVLDGHSLGGAIAQLVGKASGFATAAFNAPGALQLYDSLAHELAPVKNLGYGGTDINYRIAGDIVSLVGLPIGQTFTLPSEKTGATPNTLQLVGQFFPNHNLARYDPYLTDAAAYRETRFADASELSLAVVSLGVAATAGNTLVRFLGHVLGHAARLFDPAAGTSFTFAAEAGSPDIASITLPVETGVAAYQVRYQTGTGWSALQSLLPAATQLLPAGVHTVEFAPVDAAGAPVVMPGGFAFGASFASSGLFAGTLTISGGTPAVQPVTSPVALIVQHDTQPAPIAISAPTDAAYPGTDTLAVSIATLPSNGTVLLADGTTPVALDQLLTVAQLTTLLFRPTPGLSAASSLFEYAVADPNFATTIGVAALSIAGSGPGVMAQQLSASVDNGAGIVGVGHVVSFTLKVSAPVTVSGSPVLLLSDGAVAHYTSRSGGSTLVFAYTVQPGDNAADLGVTGLGLPGGALIRDGGGNDLSAALTGDFGLQVDTAAPSITITTPASSANPAQVTIAGLASGADPGSEVTIFDGTTLVGITGVAFDGTWSTPVTFLSTGTHTVTARVADTVGNVGISNSVSVGTTSQPPVVAAITATTDDTPGHAGAGHVVSITVGMSHPVTVVGTPILLLNDNGVATYISGSGTGSLLFTNVVQPGDSVGSLQVTGLGLPEASAIRDFAGNDLAGPVEKDLGISIGDVVSIAAANAVRPEGLAGSSTPFTFTVTLGGPTAATRTVNWSVGAGAADTHDFTGGVLPAGTLTFQAGETSKTIEVMVAGDGSVETNEAFTVTLANPSAGLAIATASANGTIVNDDAAVSIAAAAAAQPEGNSGTTAFTFTVTRTGDTAASHTATWLVARSGDHPADAADFVGGLPQGTLSFAPGETSKTVTVPVAGDTAVEFDDFFTVSLSNPSAGLSLGTAGAIGTIQNDDGANLAIAPLSASKPEGNNGTTAYTFTVSLDEASTASETVGWSVTGSGTHAADASDFGGILPSGTLSFAAGETAKTITVPVAGDTTVEFDDGFVVTLSNASSGLVLGAASSTSGTIVNDDRSTLTIAATAASKAEGNAGSTAFTFTVVLDQASTASQTVNWSVAGSGASPASASDFVGGVLPSGSVTFAAGETSKTVTVTVAGDTTVETDEGFAVGLSGPSSGLAIGAGSASGTIQNDDTSPVTPHDDAYIVHQGQSLSIVQAVGVLANDQGASTASLLIGATHGTLQLSANGSFGYTPAAGFFGIDSFTYHAGNGAEGQALVYVVPVTAGASTTLNLLALNADEQIAATYAAFFGRAADAAGFEFWVGELNRGLPVQGPAALFANIASSFGISAEAKALYPFLVNPFGATDAQISTFLDSVYNNLFNRSSDAAGLAYWTGQIKATLQAGQFVGSVLVNIMSGAQDTADGKDITSLMGKVAVSIDYVRAQEQHNIQWTGASDVAAATQLLHAVTSDPSSVLTGIRDVDALIAAHA